MNHNIHNIIGVPEGEERGQTVKNLFEEIMTKNFLILVKEKDTQVQEAQRVPNKMNPKRPIPRHIIIKMPTVRDKERILKVVRERQLVTYRRAPLRLSPDYSSETFQARGDWHAIFKVMESKDLQPRLLYPARLLFKIDGEIKSFPDKKK